MDRKVYVSTIISLYKWENESVQIKWRWCRRKNSIYFYNYNYLNKNGTAAWQNNNVVIIKVIIICQSINRSHVANTFMFISLVIAHLNIF